MRLRSYFRSGWAFLIPYLAAYLLYYWLKWPVNPAAGAEGAGNVAGESGRWIPCLLHVYWSLHAINVVLAAIALRSWWREQGKETGDRFQLPEDATRRREDAKGLASDSSQEVAEPAEEIATKSPGASSAFSFQFSAFLAALQRLAPWLLLALLFYIPGVYLEFPADPWDHYSRINEWSFHQTVGGHSAWVKSSYFLAYSLVGKIAPPTRQLFWLDFFYTGCCLLLCWQFYRLARAVGLGERASMVFVILQTVLFGNDIFGFYRYYGISSSIFAQIGAVALIRVGLEFAKRNTRATDLLTTEHAESAEKGPVAGLTQSRECAKLGPVTRFPYLPVFRFATLRPSGQRFSAFSFQSFSFQLFSFSAFSATALCLLVFIAFNHIEGIGIAGLGLLAVAVWRLIEWRRSMLWWLAAATLGLSAVAIRFFPRDPAIAGYVRDGWLTHWYGFNVFAFSLPVGDRTLQILNLFGLVNLAASLLLLCRNHIVAWLTITPLLGLSLPFVAIPFANALAQHGGDEGIITFQRMYFAIPPGLALVALIRAAFTARHTKDAKTEVVIASPPSRPSVMQSGTTLQKHAKDTEDEASNYLTRISAEPVHPNTPAAHDNLPLDQAPITNSRISTPTSSPPLAARFSFSAFQPSAFSVFLLCLTALLLVPANAPYYNRFWHALMLPPRDLQMSTIVSVVPHLPRSHGERSAENVFGGPGFGMAISATGIQNVANANRNTGTSPMMAIEQLQWYIQAAAKDTKHSLLILAHPSAIYSPRSLSAFLSTHWLPVEVPLEYAAEPQLESVARLAGGRAIAGKTSTLFLFGDWTPRK